MDIIHHFYVAHATKYGVEEAILLHDIIYWIRKNAANGKHFHDGRYWTYNSAAAFAELHPYWRDKNGRTDKVQRIINSLVKQGAIIKGNYNQIAYDRTLWYALSDELADCIFQNQEIENANLRNGKCENAEPIQDNKTNISTNNKHNISAPAFDFKKALIDLGISEQTAADWIAVRKNAKATNTQTAFNALKTQIEKIVRRYDVTAEQVAAFAVGKDWKGISAEWDAVKTIKNAIAGANNRADEELPF